MVYALRVGKTLDLYLTDHTMAWPGAWGGEGGMGGCVVYVCGRPRDMTLTSLMPPWPGVGAASQEGGGGWHPGAQAAGQEEGRWGGGWAVFF